MKEVVAVLQLWVMLFHVGVEHRHKISFLILNITLIYQIVKTDFQMNGIIKYFITYNSEKKDIFSKISSSISSPRFTSLLKKCI